MTTQPHQPSPTSQPPQRRRLFLVMSPQALPYARYALQSLFANCAEDLQLHLITDSPADRRTLEAALAAMEPEPRHGWSVTAAEDLADAEATRFRGLEHLRQFRAGHPCWRKITDPLLLSADGEELVLLDPDLYFPNRFRFEPTPPAGLLLMWQQPNCLLPREVVRRAMSAGIPLAHHVDIGVSHWRAGVDLDWLNWLIGTLGGADLPRAMHVEAIVWAALAMHSGGGHLDPTLWHCWRRSQLRRVQRKLGASGAAILGQESWQRMKCFHGGGEAKWWLPEALGAGRIQGGGELLDPGKVEPFVPLTPEHYEQEQSAKDMLRRLGYYRIMGGQNA